MASGDNWTREETSEQLREKALKVLEKAKLQEVGGQWVKTSNTPFTMVYKKEKKVREIKRFFHELTMDERSTVSIKLNQQEIYTKYRQPEWCGHAEALNILEGCQMLFNKSRRTKITQKHCKDCLECFDNQVIDEELAAIEKED